MTGDAHCDLKYLVRCPCTTNQQFHGWWHEEVMRRPCWAASRMLGHGVMSNIPNTPQIVSICMSTQVTALWRWASNPPVRAPDLAEVFAPVPSCHTYASVHRDFAARFTTQKRSRRHHGPHHTPLDEGTPVHLESCLPDQCFLHSGLHTTAEVEVQQQQAMASISTQQNPVYPPLQCTDANTHAHNPK